MPDPTSPPTHRKVYATFTWKLGRVYMSYTDYYDVRFSGRNREAHLAGYQAEYGGDRIDRQDNAPALRYYYDATRNSPPPL